MCFGLALMRSAIARSCIWQFCTKTAKDQQLILSPCWVVIKITAGPWPVWCKITKSPSISQSVWLSGLTQNTAKPLYSELIGTLLWRTNYTAKYWGHWEIAISEKVQNVSSSVTNHIMELCRDRSLFVLNQAGAPHWMKALRLST